MFYPSGEDAWGIGSQVAANPLFLLFPFDFPR
jgi:hypothetical protein